MTSEYGSTQQLIDLVEGRLDASAAQQALALVAGDPAAGATHAWISDFVSLAQRTTLEAPPAATRAALTALLPARPKVASRLQQLVDHIGRLVRDVPSGYAFAGARGATVGATRHLLFDAGDGADLMVQLDTTGGVLLVAGQILADDPAWQVSVVSEHGSIDVAADEFGEFAVHVQISAFVRLDLVTGDRRVSIDLTPFLDLAEGAN